MFNDIIIFNLTLYKEDMSNLQNWGDLFKYNKELLEDDYNHGQGVVVKTKSKASDNVTVRTIKSPTLINMAKLI